MTIRADPRSGVSGRPNMLLRFEGAALLAAAFFAYWRLGASWRQFALLFLVRVLSSIGRLAGPRRPGRYFDDASPLQLARN
jgi:hypothetical protein